MGSTLLSLSSGRLESIDVGRIIFDVVFVRVSDSVSSLHTSGAIANILSRLGSASMISFDRLEILNEESRLKVGELISEPLEESSD